MRDRVVRQLLAEYGEKRSKALMETNQKRARLKQEVPAYFEMEKELAGAMRTLSQYRIAHPQESRQEIQEKGRLLITSIRKRQEDVLASAHIKSEDLKPHFSCPLCEDTGYVGEPIHSFCTCFTKELTRRLYEDANLSGQTFADFKLSLFSREGGTQSPYAVMQRARLYCENFAQNYPNVDRHSLLLLGPTGAGKTFLLNCIGAALVARGFSVLRLSAFRLSDLMRQVHMGQDRESLQTLLQVDVLGLDDLGAEPLFENVTLPYMQYVLDERLQNRRATIITTNLSLPEIQTRYSERIFSRLTSQDTRVLRFSGKDNRNHS